MSNEFQAMAAADPGAAAALIQKLQGKIVIPHSGGQADVIASQARFRVVDAGRRWGKTKLAAREVVGNALSNPGSMNWWVANTYKNVRRGYRQVLRQIPRELLAKEPPPATANELVVQLKNGSFIEFYSGGNPDAMAGEGVDFVVVDEAGMIPEHVWFQIIRPALMDTGGRAVIISTPRGRNWFWRLYQRGQDSAYPAYASWHFTSMDNPYIPAEEHEEAKSDMPERLYRQEVLAEFIANASSLINMDKVVTVDDYAQASGVIVMGVDLAKHEDFTVIDAARESDRLPVYHDRFNDISWPDQKERIIEAHDTLIHLPKVEHVVVGVDSTGLGDAIYDDLDELGIDVEPVLFSPTKKPLYVRRLAADLENQTAFIHEEQVPEFEAYEYHITPSGNFIFEASEGTHDDEVSAKMIQHWVLTHRAGGEAHVESVPEDEEEQEEPTPTTPDSVRDIMERADAWVSA